MRELLERHVLYLTWVIALSGLCLSLFMGEVLLNEPCPLCWYQRIALFPLVFLLGIAAYRNDRGMISYALCFTSFGASMALFQVFESHFPSLLKTGVCNLGEPCDKSIVLFGQIDFATLSAIGFLLMTGLLFFGRKKPAE